MSLSLPSRHAVPFPGFISFFRSFISPTIKTPRAFPNLVASSAVPLPPIVPLPLRIPPPNMYRATTIIVLFVCAMLSMAAPLQGNTTVPDLDKRITHVGRGTWYYPSANEGNCGYWDSDSSPVVAISKARYDANGGDNCNQWIEITNTANGKTAFGKTRDSCESCDTSSLDMSPGLFKEISTLATGEITISWHFMAAGWSP